MPRIDASTVAEHRELVIGRILDAFGAEMHERGFSDLTLAQVAARAGLARSSIYHYAGDKHELMLQFVDRSVEQYLISTREELTALKTPTAQLDHLVESQIRAFRKEPGAGSAIGMLDGASLPPVVFDSLMAHLSGIHRLLGEVLAEGVAIGEFRKTNDVSILVELVSAVVASQRMPVGEGTRSIDDAVAYATEFIRAAVRA